MASDPLPFTIVREQRTTARASRSFGARSLQAYSPTFPGLWAGWLRKTFPTPEHIGVFFGCTARCAANWLDESSRPQGHYVAFALTHPEHGPGAVAALTQGA